MNRRLFLGSAGAILSTGTLAYTTRQPTGALEVRFWLSVQAAEYRGVSRRVREFLEVVLAFEYWTLEVSHGGTVDVSTEDGGQVTRRGEWPARLVAGRVSPNGSSSVADVNLLVTDGQMQEAPTGYGFSNVASVGGARHIAALESVEELGGSATEATEQWVVPDEDATRTMQVLIHEVGHALGLGHEHGLSYRVDEHDAIVATPMLSSYAWSPAYIGEHSQCGTTHPDPTGSSRKLQLSFSSCARSELETGNGGLGATR
ncbi:Matrixin [Natronorubrum sediminis]|uniref:Matrixin n=1 Tax=Natronorubrum sediminis TaxID=640943 RepID=A0A1H6G4A0_9EURY|nr:matrixin family metalloprotease [Natronorubrum sediminis]SEH17879.1 Matrixin [Natronorubrum sediminis]